MKTRILAGVLAVSAVWWQAISGRAVAAEPAAASPVRQYAPSREIDILHLALEVEPDFQERTIAATATLRFQPIARPLPELKLDAVNLEVSSVTATEGIMGWQATDQQVIVTFETPIAPGRETTLTVTYRAAPQQGLYFRTPEMGYRPEDMHLFTQGEAIDARHWFPCFDAPNEQFTSEITCRVPAGMVVLSNGKLISETKDAGTGRIAFRWLQDKPHVTYLISLLAGSFQGIEDRYRAIPLAFYTPASQIAYASNSFAGTADMLAYFEQEIGVPYPWAKYYQVCVNDFVVGGMENTSITTLTDRTLHPAEFEPLHSSQGLVAHELAHQWFGDLVTCKDWTHVWLNEGFATYYEKLYDGHKHGRDELLYRLHLGAQQILGHRDDTNAIVRRDFRNPGEQFSHLAYIKGAWVLHMLRCQLGEDLFRRCVKTYLERHQFGNVVTEDWVRVLEELSGRSFDPFFDQYVYHAHHPELNVSYRWDERSKLARISVQQVQKLSEDVLLFRVPLTVRFQSKAGRVNHQITVSQTSEDFSFALPEAPEIVRLDPELELLARITFTPPPGLLEAQLSDANDVIGRLIATEELGPRKDARVVAKLREVLNSDSFYGVRIAASKALRAQGQDEAFAALQASLAQSDARVRKQVVSDLTSYYRDESCAAALKILQEEGSPDIRAVALRALGAYHRPEVRDQLLEHLRGESYRNVLADAAIEAMRKQDDALYVEPLRDCLRTNETHFTSTGFGQGLEALAWLARNEETKDTVREFLLRHVNSAKRRVQVAAIGALGTLGDPKAVAVLETFTADQEGPAHDAAEKALAALREPKRSPREPASLRQQVAELQKQNRELRRELDELKKRVEGMPPSPGSANRSSSKSPAKPASGP